MNLNYLLIVVRTRRQLCDATIWRPPPSFEPPASLKKSITDTHQKTPATTRTTATANGTPVAHRTDNTLELRHGSHRDSASWERSGRHECGWWCSCWRGIAVCCYSWYSTADATKNAAPSEWRECALYSALFSFLSLISDLWFLIFSILLCSIQSGQEI